MPDGGLNRAIRLLHLSDLHFGAEDVEALAGVAEFAERIKPDAVVVSGDLTQVGAKREFEAARDWLRNIKGVAICTPGNHDTPVLDMTARVFSPFSRYHRYLGEFDAVDRLVELDGGRVRIAAINTARGVQARRNWADGVVDMEDLDSALTLLAGGAPDAWRLLVCHHPLVEPGHSRIGVDTLRGAEALERATAAKVDAILTGHIHDAFAHAVQTTARPIVQMGAGTLSTRLRSTPPSFCVIEIDGDTLAQEVVQIEAGGLQIRRNYVWTAGAKPPDGAPPTSA